MDEVYNQADSFAQICDLNEATNSKGNSSRHFDRQNSSRTSTNNTRNSNSYRNNKNNSDSDKEDEDEFVLYNNSPESFMHQANNDDDIQYTNGGHIVPYSATSRNSNINSADSDVIDVSELIEKTKNSGTAGDFAKYMSDKKNNSNDIDIGFVQIASWKSQTVTSKSGSNGIPTPAPHVPVPLDELDFRTHDYKRNLQKVLDEVSEQSENKLKSQEKLKNNNKKHNPDCVPIIEELREEKDAVVHVSKGFECILDILEIPNVKIYPTQNKRGSNEEESDFKDEKAINLEEESENNFSKEKNSTDATVLPNGSRLDVGTYTYVQNHFCKDLKDAKIDVGTFLQKVCPLCAYGSKDVKGPYLIEIEKVKQVYRRKVLSTPPDTLATLLCFLWNNRIYNPLRMQGKPILPFLYEMALDHVKKPHIPDGTLIAKKTIDSLLTIQNALKQIMFSVEKEKEENEMDLEDNSDNEEGEDEDQLNSTKSTSKINKKSKKIKKKNSKVRKIDIKNTSGSLKYSSLVLKDYLTVSDKLHKWIGTKRGDSVYNSQKKSAVFGTDNSNFVVSMGD